MRKGMRTAGEMRDFLLEMMEGVRNGSVELQRASTVAKLAGQVTASLCAEAQMALVADKTKREFGSALLGAPDAEVRAETMSENGNVAQLQAPKTGTPIWCDQCEERVHPTKAEACKSAFCKARAA
jgi:hypothetical protein